MTAISLVQTPLEARREDGTLRAHHAVVAAGAALIGAGAVWAVPGVAGATFTGASNGNVAFIAICDGINIGQAVYSLNPNGSPPPTYSCPGGTAPNYTQSTAGATDAMPHFSSDGKTLYFSSNRGAAGTWALYAVGYPPTVTGPPGSQTDGATQITTPNGSNDYAPTVSADGTEMSFIRCDSSNSTCHLYVQDPPGGGTPTLVATSLTLLPPDPVSGSASRPEIDPVDGTQLIYVGTDHHVHLVSLVSPPAFAERDLSQESGVGSAGDEYPDWNPTGTKITFDSTRATGGPAGHTIWSMTVNPAPAVAASLWGTNDPGTEIEPVYAPATGALVWTTLGNGSNIVEYSPNASVKNAFAVVNLTKNKTNNSQPAWQPVPQGTAVPEAPYALLVPFGGVAALLAGLGLRRRARIASRGTP